MKYELQKFNKRKVEYIQKKYKAEPQKDNIKVEEDSYIEKERKKVERSKKVLEYKEALDNGDIKEDDIPLEYKEELRRLYEEKIREIERKLASKLASK